LSNTTRSAPRLQRSRRLLQAPHRVVDHRQDQVQHHGVEGPGRHAQALAVHDREMGGRVRE
jgi:hypothetical protein